jgi:hypothetical protein
MSAYCSRTKPTVEEVNEGQWKTVRLTNSGQSMLHCGFIDFRADCSVYPLGCWELPPGEAYVFNMTRIPSSAAVEARVSGCPASDVATSRRFRVAPTAQSPCPQEACFYASLRPIVSGVFLWRML